MNRSLMLAVDKNQHRRDQFRTSARSALNNDILGKISAKFFIFIMTRTHARIDRPLLFRCPRDSGARKHAQFCSEEAADQNSSRFERPTRLPSFIEMSGLRLPFGYDRVITSKTKGKSVALDTLPDPRIPNEDLWFYPDTRTDRTLRPES